jgi:hypothetical protein
LYTAKGLRCRIYKKKKGNKAGCQLLTSVILATQEAEIRRIMVQSQPGQIVCKTISQKKKKNHKNRTCGVAQGKGPEFKLQYHQKKKMVIEQIIQLINGPMN